jgi:hypothetical protein
MYNNRRYEIEKAIQYEIQNVELLKKHFVVANELDQKFLDTIVHSSSEFNHMTDNMVIKLHSIIYGIEHECDEIRYPKNWVEALKERFAPAWVLARWPVEYKVHRFVIDEMYPQFTPTLKKYDPSIVIRQVKYENN